MNEIKQIPEPGTVKRPNYLISSFKLLRPKQWTKNALVFAALIFSRNLFSAELFLKNLLGFIIFCMVSSCVYIINDTLDREKDRNHPKKCKRPIASGAIKVSQAMAILVLLLFFSLAGSFYIGLEFALAVLAYFVLNVAYSFYLKNVPIVDMMCVAIGFVLRALAGSVLIESPLSPWLILCTFLLALFIAIHKRKSEIQASYGEKTASRSVLQFYSAEMLRDMSSAIDSATIMAYCLYTFNSDRVTIMMCTIPFVIYGLFRYQYIIHTNDLAETPEIALLTDKPLLIDILLWGITCIGALYL